MSRFSFVIISFIFAFYLFCGNFHQFFFESCFLVSPTGYVSWKIFKFDTVLKKYTRNNVAQNHLYNFAILPTCTLCWWHPQQSLSQPGRYRFPPLASPLSPKRRSVVSQFARVLDNLVFFRLNWSFLFSTWQMLQAFLCLSLSLSFEPHPVLGGKTLENQQ